jgi:hypothetical protein
VHNWFVPDHSTKEVFNPFMGEYLPIDLDLAELISYLWQRGIRTVSCCQEDTDYPHHYGKAYIYFETITDAERFLSIAAGEYSEEMESLYNRTVFHGAALETENDWYLRRRFTVEATAADVNRDFVWDPETDEDELVIYGPPKIELGILVSFPNSDIQELETRFRKFGSPTTGAVDDA